MKELLLYCGHRLRAVEQLAKQQVEHVECVIVRTRFGLWANATSVARRRASGTRATVDTLTVRAKRASAAMRLGGMWVRGSLMPRPRTVSIRCNAGTSAGR